MCDEDFLAYVTDRLATLPCVRAVALSGSRAAGTNGPASDWDFAVYYRGPFEPARLARQPRPCMHAAQCSWSTQLMGFRRLTGVAMPRNLKSIVAMLVTPRRSAVAITIPST